MKHQIHVISENPSLSHRIDKDGLFEMYIFPVSFIPFDFD